MVLFPLSMGANGPYQINHGRNRPSIKKHLTCWCVAPEVEVFFLYWGSLGGGGVIYPPNNYMPSGIFVECLVAHKLSSLLELIYILFY